MARPEPDIFTEPDFDPDTLAHLGPLAPMAGTFEGDGADVHPVAEGVGTDAYIEHYDLQPIDPQTNGPQLFYGLRYHVRIVRPGEIIAFHDQVGYWLWEPAAQAVTLTLGIPRAQVLLASGPAGSDATEFELTATAGSEIHGILSTPFLYEAFRTLSYRIHVTVNDDGTWSYEEEGVLQIPGRDEVFRHIDRNTLTRIAPPELNPLAEAARQSGTGADRSGSLGIGSLRTPGRTP